MCRVTDESAVDEGRAAILNNQTASARVFLSVRIATGYHKAIYDGSIVDTGGGYDVKTVLHNVTEVRCVIPFQVAAQNCFMALRSAFATLSLPARVGGQAFSLEAAEQTHACDQSKCCHSVAIVKPTDEVIIRGVGALRYPDFIAWNSNGQSGLQFDKCVVPTCSVVDSRGIRIDIDDVCRLCLK